MICWQCHEPIEGAVCVGCGAIQPPPPDPDPFAILALDRRYHVETKKIDEQWRAISKQVHPDRFAGQSAVMRRMSLQWTAAINTARRDLRDPERRARLLATGDPNPPETGQPPTDPDFLELVFDLQMNAQEDPQGARQQALALQDKDKARLEDIFTAWESGAGNLEEIEQLLGRIRFLQTAISQTMNA